MLRILEAKYQLGTTEVKLQASSYFWYFLIQTIQTSADIRVLFLATYTFNFNNLQKHSEENTVALAYVLK